MELSLLLGKQIIIMAVMIFVGYAAGKLKLIDLQTSVQLSKTCLYVLVPCMLLNAFQLEFSISMVRGFLFALAVAVAAQIVLVALARAVSRIFRYREIEEASIVYPNCGNLLVPIIGYMLGNEYVFYMSGFLVIQNFFMWSHGYMLISGERQIKLRKIILNPNVLAVIIGLILFFCRITLPEFLGTAVSRLGSTTGPVSMLVIGLLISEADLKKIFLDAKTWSVAIVRLLLCPAVYILMLMIVHAGSIIPDAKGILYPSFLAMAAPAASFVSQMASVLHKDEVLAGSINIMTVLLCLITMPLMTLLYQLLI